MVIKLRSFHGQIMIEINNNDDSECGVGLSIMKFTANWCGPCKTVHPIYLKMEEEFPDYKFFTVNVDDNFELASKYNVRTIPAFIITYNGKVINSFVGAVYTTPFRKLLRDILKDIKDREPQMDPRT